MYLVACIYLNLYSHNKIKRPIAPAYSTYDDDGRSIAIYTLSLHFAIDTVSYTYKVLEVYEYVMYLFFNIYNT